MIAYQVDHTIFYIFSGSYTVCPKDIFPKGVVKNNTSNPWKYCYINHIYYLWFMEKLFGENKKAYGSNHSYLMSKTPNLFQQVWISSQPNIFGPKETQRGLLTYLQRTKKFWA